MSNSDTLRELKADYGITTQKVADIMGVSLKAVNSWLLPPGSKSHRNMTDSRLDHLKSKLSRMKRVK